MKKLIIFIAITYIIGLSLGFQFEPSTESLSFFGQTALFFLLLSIAVHFLKYRFKEQIKTVSVGLCTIYFGLFMYTYAMDTSSPEHIVHYLDKSPNGETVIRGIVTEDPDIRESYINLIVRPYEVQPEAPFGKFQKISKGKMIIKLNPELKQYFQFDYADKIEVRGKFLPFPEDNNPGIFDQQAFNIHKNIWGRITVKDDRNITLIGKEYPNKIIELSYKIKDKMLLTIKKTMRYPESAFLGGVTLGLRAGLSYESQEEFRRTGIAHILAVSGLHVGFIYILLLSFFSLIRVPKQISAPLIIFLLTLFVFITGARPATIRAAMMVSILVIISAYFKGKLQNNLNVSLAITALIYLIFINPLMLVEASFVMSFTAILSISLFASPISQLLSHHVKGYSFIAFLIISILLTVILMTSSLSHIFFSNVIYIILFILLAVILFKISFKLNQKNPQFNFGLASLGSFVVGFMGVQFGITLGNVFPVGAIYFQKFAVAGLYANWIAIPLIGVIVQLGIIAGIFGFLFTPLALVVNAANYIFSNFFLTMAHFFAEHFPYPIVMKPTPIQIVLYYLGISVLIWYPQIKASIKDIYFRLILLWERYELRRDIIILFSSLALILLIGSSYVMENLIPEKRLQLTFVDTKALGRFGNGNSFLLECPDNKNYLINAGAPYVHFKSGDFILSVSVGDTVIRPMLTAKRITTLDGIILQNLDPLCIGGFINILENFNVKCIFSYYPFDKIAKQMDIKLKWWNIFEENRYKRAVSALKKGGTLQLLSKEKVNIRDWIKTADISSDEKSTLIKHLLAKSTSFEHCQQILKVIAKVRQKRIEKQLPSMEKIISFIQEPEIAKDYNAIHIIGRIAQLIKEKNIKFKHIEKGSQIKISKQTKIDVLSPGFSIIKETDNYLDRTLVLMVHHDKRKILIPGNAPSYTINRLMQEYKYKLKCDILGVPDYGSEEANTLQLIKYTQPEYAVCHYYYQPRRYFKKETYLNYHCSGTVFYKTDEDGAIVFNIKNNKMKKKKWIFNDILRYKTTKKLIPKKKFRNKEKLLKFVTLDTGIGQVYYVQTPDKKNYLINSGRGGDNETISDAGKGIVVPFLKKEGITKLNGVFMLNSMDENIAGLYYVISAIPTEVIYKSTRTSSTPAMSRIENIATLNNIRINTLSKGNTIELNNNIKCFILNPENKQNARDEKDLSLVLKLVYNDFSMLITGNITGKDYDSKIQPASGTAEHNLMKYSKGTSLKSTVMTVPNAGFRSSSTLPFLKTVDAQYAILSIPKYDRYNPSDDLLYRYQKADIQIYRTDYDGNIYLYTDGKNIEINTEEKNTK